MPLYNASPYTGPEKINYLFIDGGCLDTVLEMFSTKLFNGKQIEIDYNHLTSGYHKVFYYDCLPAQKQGEAETDYQERTKPKIKLFNYLKSLNRFHVYEGTARYRDKRRGQEQKQVDIMIAVDMLTHSFRKNMHEATLLTGDLDFKPLIDALVQDGMYISLWYPKTRTNYELVDAADSKQPLVIDTIWGWMTESFRKTVKLPVRADVGSLDPFNHWWTQLDKIEKETYEVLLYEKEGKLAAILRTSDYSCSYYHDNLEQLKFYLEHIYEPNVFR